MIVTYYYPWNYFHPATSGAAHTAARHLEYFRSREIRPRIIINGEMRRDARREFERYYHWAEEIFYVPRRRYPAIDQLASLFTFRHYLLWHVAMCDIGELRDVLSKPADLCFINYVFATPLLDAMPRDAMRVLESHDVMSRQFVRGSDQPVMMEHHLRTEFDLYQAYDTVIMVNDLETRLAHARGALHARYLPRAIDMADEGLGFEEPAPAFDLLFVGSDHLPNAEGAGRFYHDIFQPYLRPKGLKWAIAGSVCDRLSIKDSAVAMLGRVNDLDALYRNSKVVIVPLFSGAGISLKTLEALGHGKPVVATPFGARGVLGCEQALQLLPLDKDFEAAAGRILELRGSSALRNSYSREAIQYIQRHFSREAFSQNMDAIFAPLLKAGPHSGDRTVETAAWQEQSRGRDGDPAQSMAA